MQVISTRTSICTQAMKRGTHIKKRQVLKSYLLNIRLVFIIVRIPDACLTARRSPLGIPWGPEWSLHVLPVSEWATVLEWECE